MEPVYYTVTSIDGDYAHMTSDSGVENRVAMFLLPEGDYCGEPSGTGTYGMEPGLSGIDYE